MTCYHPPIYMKLLNSHLNYDTEFHNEFCQYVNHLVSNKILLKLTIVSFMFTICNILGFCQVQDFLMTHQPQFTHSFLTAIKIHRLSDPFFCHFLGMQY